MGQTLKESVRKLIVDSAIIDLFENGYQGSSMRKIASHANMTVGNLYRYFKNKDELVNTIIQPVLNRINQVIQKNTNQIINLNDEHFDLSHVPIENIMITIDELSDELVNIYYETPKLLTILMMKSTVYENILKWFSKLIMEFMISKEYVNDENRKRCELLARSYGVSLFAGIKECLNHNELEKNELVRVIRMYFRSCMLIIENSFKELED